MSERHAGTGAESGESRTLGPSRSAKEKDVDGGAGQSSQDNEQDRDDDDGRRDALLRSATPLHLDLAMGAFEVVGALAQNLAVSGARASVLARAAVRRRTRSFLSRVARHLVARLHLDGGVGAGASVSARNQETEMAARAVEARVANGRVVAILAVDCLYN